MRAFLTLAFCGVALAADLTVGSATARHGQKSTGVLAVPAGVDAASSLAVILINGAKPGPTLALVSGSHGTEYASIVAMEKLADSIEPSQLSGAVIIVPLVNPASFAQKVPHLNPVDGKNMNRYYPGKAEGTQTERVSWAIAKQVVEKCDYLLDFHGGDLDENLRRYAYWADTGNARLDTTTRGMVLAFGLDHIIIQRWRPSDPPPAAITLTRYASSIGKPAVAAEAGHAGTVAGRGRGHPGARLIERDASSKNAAGFGAASGASSVVWTCHRSCERNGRDLLSVGRVPKPT